MKLISTSKNNKMNTTDGLLVYLVNPWEHEGAFINKIYQPPPDDCLGIGYIAAVLRDCGYKVRTFDAYVTPSSPKEIAEQIKKDANGCEVVLGFSLMEPIQVEHAELVTKLLRSDKVSLRHVMAGGQFASTNYRTLLLEFSETFQSVIHGEAENIIEEVMARIVEGQSVSGLPGVIIRDGEQISPFLPSQLPSLTHLPWPARDSLDALLKRQGIVNVDTSRGCGSSCIFCMSINVAKHHPSRKRWRSRTPSVIADEMEFLFRTHGVKKFNFTDENIMGDTTQRGRLLTLAEELQDRKLDIKFNAYFRAEDLDAEVLRCLQDAGLVSVFTGIESFYQPMLDRLNKKATEADNIHALRELHKLKGLRLSFGLMTYHPWTTMKEVLHNIRRIREEVLGLPLTGPEMIRRFLQVMYIYKGTPAYQLAKKQGLIKREPRFEQWCCDYYLPVKAQRLQSFVMGALEPITDPQHKLFLLWSANADNYDDATLQQIWQLTDVIENHVLDSVEHYVLSLEGNSENSELYDIARNTLARSKELISALNQMTESNKIIAPERSMDGYLA